MLNNKKNYRFGSCYNNFLCNNIYWQFYRKKNLRIAEYALKYFDHITESTKLKICTYVMITSNILNNLKIIIKI